MKKIIINGESWCRTLTGVERVARETVAHLDALASPSEIELVVPKNARDVPPLKNINITRLNKEAHFFPAWTQIAFQKYVIEKRGISLDFSNTCPYFSPGVEYIHDIYFALHKEDAKTRREKLIQFYSRAMYRRIASKAKKIIAVSEFTKKTLVETYRCDPQKIAVIYDGISDAWRALEADTSIFNKFPALAEKPFYFTLGSLSIRKNLKWISRHAELYPNDFFVISGMPISGGLVPPELSALKTLKNVLFTGYLSDAEVKTFMGACKAFVFPSYFEGFGIPPLEALSCGAKIIISNRTSLPEIYGKTAHYIDPDEPRVNLDALLTEPVELPDKLLKSLTVKNSAEKLYAVLKGVMAE